jgi:hypothetical protein
MIFSLQFCEEDNTAISGAQIVVIAVWESLEGRIGLRQDSILGVLCDLCVERFAGKGLTQRGGAATKQVQIIYRPVLYLMATFLRGSQRI